MGSEKMKKIILISGCSSGLGRRVAEILEGKGHKVYAGIRNSKKRQDLNVKWKDTHPNISAIELDITDDKSCTFVVNKIINKVALNFLSSIIILWQKIWNLLPHLQLLKIKLFLQPTCSHLCLPTSPVQLLEIHMAFPSFGADSLTLL